MDKAINKLNTLNIGYELIEHPAIYTIEDMNALNLNNSEKVAKNLFIRDDKKRNYYLIVVKEDRQINLKELRALISSRALSFSSENDLTKYLSLEKGSVTPLGIINNEDNNVCVYIDSYFKNSIIGVHPNVNTSTVFLNSSDLIRFIQDCGNEVNYIEF